MKSNLMLIPTYKISRYGDSTFALYDSQSLNLLAVNPNVQGFIQLIIRSGIYQFNLEVTQ